MEEPTQEQLLNYIDAAMIFYEQVRGKGYAPTNKQLQALLAVCGVHVAFERIKVNRDVIRELEREEEAPPGERPYFSSYLLPGRPSDQKIDPDTYQPEEGDLYILEVRTGRFTIHRYDGESWEQLGAGHSEQDIKTLIAPMQFLGESKGHRLYYRPTGEPETFAED